MKLSVAETIILILGAVVLPALFALLLTPSTDPITMGLLWLGGIAVFLFLFFAARWLLRHG